MMSCKWTTRCTVTNVTHVTSSGSIPKLLSERKGRIHVLGVGFPNSREAHSAG